MERQARTILWRADPAQARELELTAFMQKPRVLHVLAINGVGGVESIFVDYLTRSDPAGAEQHVLVTHGRCHRFWRAKLESQSKSIRYANYWRGIKVPSLGDLRRRHIFREISAVRPDVVVIWNALGEMDLADAAARAPAVYIELGAAWGNPPEADVGRFLGKMTRVIGNSYASRRMLELRWKAESKKNVVLLNPVRSDLAEGGFEEHRRGTRTPLRLGIIGRMVAFKGFPLAFHALAHLLRDGIACDLHVAGQGRDEAALKELARKLSLEDHIRFLGSFANPAAFYREIDVFLCPSIREPFGNVAIEAAYAGCPVVAAAVDGLPEVVQHERTGLCIQPTLPISDYPQFGGSPEQCPAWVYDPVKDALQQPRLLDPRAIAQAVKSIINPPERWRAMSDAARERALRDFRMDDFALRLNQQFLDVCRHGD
ncbi:MAG: glycosyltransferase family 4 protein [Candidatus Brocadiia bacterium]|jgi:glycosyltransferase involved in cell wall biosynthesis